MEASLIFPILFYTILLLMFFCMYLYQKAVLNHSAALAASRIAYTWDNSYRDIRTGAIAEISQMDPLYWRLSEDGMLQGLFGLGKEDVVAQMSVPVSELTTATLLEKKLSRIAKQVSETITGSIYYDNKLLYREIIVQLQRNIRMEPLSLFLKDTVQSGGAMALVVEPVEWIRTVELVQYYGAKFNGQGEEWVDRKEASDVLKRIAK